MPGLMRMMVVPALMYVTFTSHGTLGTRTVTMEM